MKIAHFIAFDTGGAAAGAMRLHRSLLAAGHESSIHLMQARGGTHVDTTRRSKFQRAIAMLRPHLERLPVELLHPHRQGKFSLGWLPNSLLRRVAESGTADILHLHWLGEGFINIAGLKDIKLPLVWTMHDMWPFTGGCYYDAECGRFTSGCGRCPVIESNSPSDLSNSVMRRKKAAWQGLNLSIVTPSRWMAGEARRSSLFKDKRVEVIPYCLDLSVFKPVDRAAARSLFNLPSAKRLILFGAVNQGDPRKGYAYLEKALSHMIGGRHGEGAEIVIFGGGSRKTWQQAGFTWHCLGPLHDEVALSLAYNAADVFVAPSLQECFGLVVLEALACGTPCAAFDLGGIPDLIMHKTNGYLAQPRMACDLARGIEYLLDDANSGGALRATARESVMVQFAPETVSARHIELYRELAPASVG